MTISLRSLAIRLVAVALSLIATGSVIAAPIALSTPAGLNAGDKFRYLFLTDGSKGFVTNPLSTDIATYNAFVNTAAGGATYGGSTVTWYAIGSTPTVNARDNVGGLNSNVPVYNMIGNRLADNMGVGGTGLWPGIFGSLLDVPRYTIDGTFASDVFTFTGTTFDGTKEVGKELGTTYPTSGGANFKSSSYLLFAGAGGFYLETKPMYGVSEELTVSAVPEIDPAGMGSVLALVTGALGLLERRRSKSA